MKINLTEIYAGLKAYRAERGLTAENQKAGYIVNVMEEMGELAKALRDYEKIKNGEQAFKMTTTKMKLADDIFCEVVERKALCLADAEHEIIDAICDIAVLTINAGANIPREYKLDDIDLEKTNYSLTTISSLMAYCATYSSGLECSDIWECDYFSDILIECAKLCEQYGFNFEVAMIETIKEISSRTGSYDEVAKKWVKDESDEAKSKWYKADYEKARISK